MVLSPAEKAYIYDGLVSSKVSRSDSRRPDQYRPMKATCSLLPNSNGSSRVYTADGIECITSIKANVVRCKDLEKLINLDFEIQGERDDTILTTNTITTLKNSIMSNVDVTMLKITEKYYFQLNIDIAVLAIPSDFQGSSYTLQSLLALASMGLYLAIQSTKVPRLTSQENDGDIEEEPTFNDDWDSAIYLTPRDSLFKPTLLFVLGIAGDNVIIDPTLEEQQVLEHGICVGFANNELLAPIQSLLISKDSSKGINQSIIFKALDMVKSIGPEVTKALDEIANQEIDAFELAF